MKQESALSSETYQLSKNNNLNNAALYGTLQSDKQSNLENEISAQNTVQNSLNVTTENGCELTLVFRQEANPQIRKDVAAMLLAAFERRSKKHEESSMSVQSIH